MPEFYRAMTAGALTFLEIEVYDHDDDSVILRHSDRTRSDKYNIYLTKVEARQLAEWLQEAADESVTSKE
jgi:hypothetical protein